MTNKKRCPLKRMPNGAFGYCYEEECAWYDTYYNQCAITTIKMFIMEAIHRARKQQKSEKP